ncbi:MAG: DUF2958 domain-containing protein [Anaerolineales bacterium]|nr:DUF2958 domain-containing protein [Anaerolineales bacterium]
MSPEQLPQPAPKKPYEIFGFTENESLYWRVSDNRFEEILEDKQTVVHTIQESSNNYGEFLFVTASRPGLQERICITFFGLGYHEYRERWISNEWFWYQSSPTRELLGKKMDKDEAKEILSKRQDFIAPYLSENTQTGRGHLFETLADMTDEDGAMAEMEELDSLDQWLAFIDLQTPPEEPPPTGDNLLDQASREKLPPLYSGEELGLDAIAQVKFFTPDALWTWYASEFDGADIFFGLVNGLELELGYFSLKELQEVRGPMGLPIERDLYYEPKTLRELKEMHGQERRG